MWRLALALVALTGTCSATWKTAAKNTMDIGEAPVKNPVVRYIVLANPHNGEDTLQKVLGESKYFDGFRTLFSFKDTNQTWEYFSEKMDNYFKCSCPRTYDAQSGSCLPYPNWSECKQKVGFLWYYGQGLEEHQEEFAEYLRNNFVRVIVLNRHNCLNKLAEIVMKTNGSNHVDVTPQRAKYFCSHEDISKLQLETIAKNAHSHLTMEIEQIRSRESRGEMMMKLQEFMLAPEVPQMPETHEAELSQMVSIHSVINNFEELKESLTGTDIEEFLSGKVQALDIPKN